MKITTEELALLVERLLKKRAEEERKRRWKEVMDSDQFIKDVHESDTGISSKSFEIISESQTESGDTIIEFEAIQWLETEFTINAPHQFEVKGKLLLRKDGEAELLYFR